MVHNSSQAATVALIHLLPCKRSCSHSMLDKSGCIKVKGQPAVKTATGECQQKASTCKPPLSAGLLAGRLANHASAVKKAASTAERRISDGARENRKNNISVSPRAG